MSNDDQKIFYDTIREEFVKSALDRYRKDVNKLLLESLDAIEDGRAQRLKEKNKKLKKSIKALTIAYDEFKCIKLNMNLHLHEIKSDENWSDIMKNIEPFLPNKNWEKEPYTFPIEETVSNSINDINDVQEIKRKNERLLKAIKKLLEKYDQI